MYLSDTIVKGIFSGTSPHQDHIQKPGSMDPLDPSHLNVCRRAGAGNKGGEARRFKAARKILGQRLDNLRGAQNAEMEIRQQGQNAPALRR